MKQIAIQQNKNWKILPPCPCKFSRVLAPTSWLYRKRRKKKEKETKNKLKKKKELKMKIISGTKENNEQHEKEQGKRI